MKNPVLFILWIALAIAAEARPNILLIVADDLGYGDLGCYGQELIQTPRLDRLAEEGMRFTQAYAGSTVCAASRAVLMTGLHNGHAPARDNIPHYPTYLEDGDVTLAEVLQETGYVCGGIGKWSLGDPGTAGRPTNQGFESWLGYLNQDHAHYYYPEYLDDGEGRLELTGNTETQAHYTHHLMTERALEFIEGHQEEPFFFYAAYTLPHFSSAKEDPTRLAIPSDEPYSDRDWTQAEKNYAAMVTLLDRDVGRMLDLLEKLGLRENTLVIFTSDNGPWGAAPKRFASAGPLRGTKRDLYEGGIRVPFLASWPGVIPAGETSEELLAFWDLLPTLAEAAGAKAPPNLDGRSRLAALKGQVVEGPHDFLYWDYGHCRNRYDQAVRQGPWKGVRLGLESPLQLYHLPTDIGEKQDVAAENPEIVARLEAILATTATPSERYPIGKLYKGEPLWKP